MIIWLPFSARFRGKYGIAGELYSMRSINGYRKLCMKAFAEIVMLMMPDIFTGEPKLSLLSALDKVNVNDKSGADA
jgi:hypothetical protein